MDNSPTPPPYILRAPAQILSPFVFAAPHSGRFYPPDFIARSAPKGTRLRQSEDAFVDQLFEGIPQMGAALLVATHARAYLDLNRAANELDPTMFTPQLDPAGLNINHRVSAGLGLIPKIIAEGVPIYKSLLPAREAFKRTAAVHTPYHQKLAQLLKERQQKFGVAYLIDCHSMPSGSTVRRARKPGPDIVLGDSWGSACSREFTSLAEQLFIGAGFNVRRNVPYSGGFSTVHYGQPRKDIHALQIEINRRIYLDEASQSKLPEFTHVQKKLLEVCQQLTEQSWPQPSKQVYPLAAE
jgi:N-formylglutamate amidohydrolase